MKISRIIGSAMLALVVFQACEKNEAPVVVPTLTEKTVSGIPADTIVGLVNGQPVGAGKYTFFSFETNAVVPSTDSNSVKWDVAVRGTTIITNGGNSGPGVGGAFVYVGTFDDLKTVPKDSVFRQDNAPTSYAVPNTSNRGWYVYSPVSMLITPIPGRVLVFKTAKGKYAKVEILNYYKGGVTPAATATDAEKLKNQRYYSFRFAYQSDGTMNFK